MRKPLFFSLIFLGAVFLIVPKPILAITPVGVNPIPQIPFVFNDCENLDWSVTNPELGPVGGWTGSYGCNEERNLSESKISDYIKRAQSYHVTLDDGTVIEKPVGIGIQFSSGNINNYRFLNDRETYRNLAFIVAEAKRDPTCDTTGQGCCDPYGEMSSECIGQAIGLLPKLAEAFPDIPVFFQACTYSSDLCNRSVTNPNGKSISVKCNGWDEELYTAMTFLDGVLIGGQMGFASVYHDRMIVGFEPKNGFGPGGAGAYWQVIQALSHHPDFFDIAATDLISIASFKPNYGFDLSYFLRSNMGKTINEAVAVWTVLRENQSCCSASNGCCTAQDGISENCNCCYSGASGKVCTGPQRGNFDYWLYQKDGISNGRTKLLYKTPSSPGGELLPTQAVSHPYGYYTARRTDQGNNNPYMFFDIEDDYASLASQQWVITATFFDNNSGSFSLDYYNTSGQLTKKSQSKNGSNSWVDYTWQIDDANFNNQFGSGQADFRINSQSLSGVNDGDEIVHRVIVKPVSPAADVDLNGDGKIDEVDLTILLSGWDTESEITYNLIRSYWRPD